jgi:hypothetical protein
LKLTKMAVAVRKNINLKTAVKKTINGKKFDLKVMLILKKPFHSL